MFRGAIIPCLRPSSDLDPVRHLFGGRQGSADGESSSVRSQKQDRRGTSSSTAPEAYSGNPSPSVLSPLRVFVAETARRRGAPRHLSQLSGGEGAVSSASGLADPPPALPPVDGAAELIELEAVGLTHAFLPLRFVARGR